MFEPIRGGTRGGQAEFKWSDVSADKDRENYLGHSINAPTGRWQKSKDVHWYNREKKQEEHERLAEIQRIKDLEADALAVALGFEPAKKPAIGTTTTTTVTSPTSPTSITLPTGAFPPAKTDAQRALEKEEKRRRKAERKEEKRARKKKRRRILDREPSRTRRYTIEDGRGRDRDRDHDSERIRRSPSRSRSRSWSRTPPLSTRRRSASPRRREWSPQRRSRSRSPPHRPGSYHRDTFSRTYESARRRSLSLSRSPSLRSSRSRTSSPPPPRRVYEPIRKRRDSYLDGQSHDRGRGGGRPIGNSGARRELSVGGPPSDRHHNRDRHR